MKNENQTKHTPGPWKANRWAPGFEVGAPDSHCTVCSLAGYNNEDGNARLIAAAPDLLEALKAMLAIHGPVATVQESVKALNQARAAISKATGE